jgi:hypothetical protein
MDGAGGTAGSNTEDRNGIGEKEDGVNEPREITELMNDLTELDEWPDSVPCWGRCRATWCCDVRGGWWVGGWVFGVFSRLLGWVG